MSDKHTGRKLAVGSLVAGVAGYLAGILTAPKSGSETRKDIASKAEDVKLEAEEQLQAAHDELNVSISHAKTRAISLGAQAREEFNKSVIKAKDARSKAATVLKAIKVGQADDPELNKAIKQVRAAQKNLSRYLKS